MLTGVAAVIEAATAIDALNSAIIVEVVCGVASKVHGESFMDGEKIEEVLSIYKGAILFASHDRYFIKNLADKILEFDDKSLLVHNYGYEEYIERKNSLNHNTNEDDILKLELELAYISGKLADPLLEPSEKELLDKRFIHIYRNINLLKNK